MWVYLVVVYFSFATILFFHVCLWHFDNYGSDVHVYTDNSPPFSPYKEEMLD